MKASDYNKSKWLKADDLDEARKLRIRDVSVERIGIGKDQEKLVVWFEDEDQGLVLNSTNNRTLMDAFGDETDDWASQVIVLFPTTADYRGRQVAALRVRIPPSRDNTTSTVSRRSRQAAVAVKGKQLRRPRSLIAAPPSRRRKTKI